MVIPEPLGIFNELSVNGFWVPLNIEFRELFIANVDCHSVPYSNPILIANLVSSSISLESYRANRYLPTIRVALGMTLHIV